MGVPKIYLVEDDASLREGLARLLDLQGFECAVCDDFPNAASCALRAQPDCVVLDLKLPGGDGHAVCRDIRRESQIPIVVLTSSDSEFDEVMSMNLGADDYVTKPYRPAVLIARIQSLLRRSGQSAASALERAGVSLDTGRSTVSYLAAEAELTRNELRILRALMENAGAIVSRQDLMVELWQSDEFVDDNTLTVNVNRLRKSLASIGVPDDFLVTRRGQGYLVK